MRRASRSRVESPARRTKYRTWAQFRQPTANSHTHYAPQKSQCLTPGTSRHRDHRAGEELLPACPGVTTTAACPVVGLTAEAFARLHPMFDGASGPPLPTDAAGTSGVLSQADGAMLIATHLHLPSPGRVLVAVTLLSKPFCDLGLRFAFQLAKNRGILWRAALSLLCSARLGAGRRAAGGERTMTPEMDGYASGWHFLDDAEREHFRRQGNAAISAQLRRCFSLLTDETDGRAFVSKCFGMPTGKRTLRFACATGSSRPPSDLTSEKASQAQRSHHRCD